MSEERKSIMEEVGNFLDYLSKNEHNEENRKEENLKLKFGKEKYNRIYGLIGGKMTGMLPIKKVDVKSDILYIRDEGLKYLEEYYKEKRAENNNRTTLFLTSILVLTTIAQFFNELNLINKWALMFIYLIFSLLLLSYFKKAKNIKV